ncbi:sensor histidine kinase [Arthrobacter sp. TMS1-12-1]
MNDAPGLVAPAQHLPAVTAPGTTLLPGTSAGLGALVGAFGAMAEDIDLNSVLERVVSAACELVGARYGALGVIGPDGLLSAFITVGSGTDETAPLPRGQEDPRKPGVRTFVDVPIRIRDRVFGNLYLTEKNDGGGFTGIDEKLLVALAAAAAIAIANSRLFDDSTRRSRWLEGGLEAVRGILEQTDPARTDSESVAHFALRASHSDVVLVLREVGDQQGLHCEAAAGADAGSYNGGSVNYPALLDGLTAASPPLLLTAADIALLLPCSSPLVPSTALCVRLAGSGEREYLLFGRRAGVPFTDVDHDMVRTFTSHASLALELLRAHRWRAQEAVFGNRDRIARDLHDLVIQRLFAAGLSIQVLRGHLTDRKALERIGTVTTELDATIREMRDTIYSLRSVPRITSTFSAGIFALVATTVEGHLPHPVLHLSGPLDAAVDPELADHVQGVLRESLSRALRHAAARSIMITLQAHPDRLEMGVTDDGRGLTDPSSWPGLARMQRQAELCDATLSISSTHGQGTQVLLVAPLSTQEG